MNRDNSEIRVGSGGAAFVGPDAVMLVRAVQLKVALGVYAHTGLRVSGKVSPGMMLAAATQFTGKRYGRHEYAKAAVDVGKWVDTMRAALPVTIVGEAL